MLFQKQKSTALKLIEKKYKILNSTCTFFVMH